MPGARGFAQPSPHLALAHPGEQRLVGHAQVSRQFPHGHLAGLTLELIGRSQLPRGCQSLHAKQIVDHAAREAALAFGRLPALLIQRGGDGSLGLARTTQLRDTVEQGS